MPPRIIPWTLHTPNGFSILARSCITYRHIARDRKTAIHSTMSWANPQHERCLLPLNIRPLRRPPVLLGVNELEVKVKQDLGHDHTHFSPSNAVEFSEKCRDVLGITTTHFLPMQSRGPYENGRAAPLSSLANSPSLVSPSHRSGRKERACLKFHSMCPAVNWLTPTATCRRVNSEPGEASDVVKLHSLHPERMCHRSLAHLQGPRAGVCWELEGTIVVLPRLRQTDIAACGLLQW